MKRFPLSSGILCTFVLMPLAYCAFGKSDAGDSISRRSYNDPPSKRIDDYSSPGRYTAEEDRGAFFEDNHPLPSLVLSGESYGRESQIAKPQQQSVPNAVPSPNLSSEQTYEWGSSHYDSHSDNARTFSNSRGTESQRLPIHYDFPVDRGHDDTETLPKFASARHDLITSYMATTAGRLRVRASSTVIGGAGGVFLAKSMIPVATAVLGGAGAFSFLVGTVLRTPFGELVRALGLSLILVLQRTTLVRRKYPTWRYVPAFFGVSSSSPRPFPPARNPWKYTPRRSDDVEFSMLYSIVAMAFMGSVCGGNVPVIPVWMGSLTGAALFGVGCTLSSSRGDLCRSMGMRIVALLQELWDIQADLQIIPKAAVVSGQILDRLMIFDRKHRVKDRFLTLVARGYDQVMQATSQVKADGERPKKGSDPDEGNFIVQGKNDAEDGISGRNSPASSIFGRNTGNSQDSRDFQAGAKRHEFENDFEGYALREKSNRSRFWRK
eukprot:scaffold2306_cov132-Cylindrotheca_fusiformis.AAC.3